MATTWYYRNTNWGATGPGETYYTSDVIVAYSTSYSVNFKLDSTPGSAQSSIARTRIQVANEIWGMGHWISPPLAAQTLTGSGAGYKVAVAIKESSAAMNLYHRIFVYIWRSGSGNVKTIYGPASCTTEHGTSETECVITFNGTAGDFSILDNDRIVIEELFDVRNSKTTSYTATLYYDGTDTTMVDDEATSDAGSYFYCPQTLNLYTGGETLSINVADKLAGSEALD